MGREMDEAAISTVTIVSEEAEAHDWLLTTVLLLVMLLLGGVDSLKVSGSRVAGVHTGVHMKCIKLLLGAVIELAIQTKAALTNSLLGIGIVGANCGWDCLLC